MEITKRGFLGSLVATMICNQVRFSVKANPVIPHESNLLYERILRLRPDGPANLSKFWLMPAAYIQHQHIHMMGSQVACAISKQNYTISFEKLKYKANQRQIVLGAHLLDDEGFIIGYHDYTRTYQSGIYMYPNDELIMTHIIADINDAIRAIKEGHKDGIIWNGNPANYMTGCARVDVDKYVRMNNE